MQFHSLKRNNPNKKKVRVGRGGKRGKTSGRGHKGQGAHSSSSPRAELRDIIKRIPKRRGYGKNRARTVNSDKIKHSVINLATINQLFEKGETVSPRSLVLKGVFSRRGGRYPQVKILGQGDLQKAVSVEKCTFSASAEEKIKKAGGTIL